jgi:PAS domain S-box-containing protein
MAEICFDAAGQQAVRQLEGLLSIFDGFDGIVYVADVESFEILYANRYAKERYGDLVGKICWQALRKDQDGSCPFCASNQLLDAAGKPTGSTVGEFQNAETGIWYQCTGRSIPWPSGKYVRMQVAVNISRLKLAEEKYRSIFENAVEGIFQATPEGKYISVNPAFARMCGFQTPEEMVTAITDIQRQLYVNPADRTKIQALYNEVGIVRNFEAEFKCRGGQKIWVSINARTVRDDDGNIRFYEGTIEDITERKLAEYALRHSEERFSIAFNESPAPTIVSTVDDGRYVDVNRSFLNMLQFSREEVIGKTALDLGVWADPQDRFAVVEKLRREGFLRDEPLNLRRKTGEIRHVLVSAQIINLYDEDLILSLFQDITERTRIEAIMRESEQRYRDFFRTSRDCVFITSVEGEWIDFNDAAMELFGYENRAELMKVRIPDLYEIPEHRKALLRLVQKHGSLRDYAVDLRSKQGSIIRASITCVLHRDKEGNPLYFQGTVKDLTEQRRLEARLQHAQKMEAIGTLAGGIAHDFNNILGMITGFAEIALMELPEGSRPATSLQKALKAAHRAKDLVKQIVSFSRPVVQKRRLIEIGPIIVESLKLLRATLPATVKILEDIESEGAVYGDPSEIHQIIMNLCTNANLAMRGRVGVLKVSLHDVDLKTIRTLDYRDLHPGNYVRLTVTDTGEGIAPSIKERIFDPYFTTRPTGEGSGLGLSIVHGIVMSYGGSIKVDSFPGEGATFEIYLPAEKWEGLEFEPDEIGVIPTGSGTILFIDDESALVDIGKHELELLGYRVVATSDCAYALKTFRQHPEDFDLVMSDMSMPLMTGVELARKVMEIRPDIPVILCTGYSDLVEKEKMEELGIKEFVIKPLDLRGLARIVRRVLDKKSS